ncbi:polysaccharide deacetylase [Halalkalicoccus paucihalophilus]|uniref:Polysaccharide deacetylase n=2 Tax=Halalkalicoccus paucihalophilus TaxID=1008153 RepID=A0A151ABF0_9EURY|nr:polysaccharide deacetylase family protein [Halalkalicoccus paucihalophilus]KYH25026.1 polysaccharide deacetylase [Halalkalicoccus paucihalophilus]
MDKSAFSRRRVLSLGAIGMASFAGCLGSSDNGGKETSNDESSTDEGTSDNETDTNPEQSESEGLPDNGAVVFVYDDGPMKDYTQAFPAHQAFDAPATTGIITGRIGLQNYNGYDWMDVEQLEELEAAGWEIASHTTEHSVVGTYELVEDADASDDRVYPEEIRHGYWTSKDLEITDGKTTVTRTIVGYGEDDVGKYIEFDGSLGESFTRGETVTRYGEEAMHEALGESKRKLESLGFEIDSFLAPYDNFDDYSRKFVRQYYNAVANAEHGSRINDPDEFDPFYTHRDYFIEFSSPDRVKADLDEIADRGALGVFGAHTYKEEVTEERIYETLEWVDERGIEVLTLREACQITS